MTESLSMSQVKKHPSKTEYQLKSIKLPEKKPPIAVSHTQSYYNTDIIRTNSTAYYGVFLKEKIEELSGISYLTQKDSKTLSNISFCKQNSNSSMSHNSFTAFKNQVLMSLSW